MYAPAEKERRRIREALKYLPWWQPGLTSAFEDGVPRVPISSPDKALNAFAQLVALRLDVDRVLISLIGDDEQFILNEATRTLSSELDSRHDADDAMLFGMATIRRHQGLCGFVMSEPPSEDGGETPPGARSCRIVPDIQTDADLKDRPFTRANPGLSLYIATPLEGADGHCIGSICAYDRSPRSSISVGLQQFLRDISVTVVRHLKAEKSARDLRRSLKLFGALERFMDTGAASKVSIGDQEVFESDPGVGRKAPPPPPPPPSPPPPSSHPQEPGGSESPQAKGRPSGNATEETQALQQALVSSERASLFERASRVLCDGFQASGVLFLDASSGQVGGNTRLRSNVPGQTDSSGQEEESTNLRTPRSGSPGAMLAPCNVLGSALLVKSPPVSVGGISERDLKKLLRVYPTGQIFHVESDDCILPSSGESSDTPGELSVEDRIRLTPPPAAKARRQQRSLINELKRMVTALPGVRCFAIFPSWDYRRERWFAAGILWSTSPRRLLLGQDDLKFLRAFGNCIMAEVARQDAQLDETKKSAFLSLISHELRTPLHGIFANVELLRNEELAPLQAAALRTIDCCNQTLLDVINHLLDHNALEQQSMYNRRRKAISRGGSIFNKIAEPVEPAASEVLDSSEPIDLAAVTEDVVRGMTSDMRLDLVTEGRHQEQRKLSTLKASCANELLEPVVALLDVEYHRKWMVHVHPGGFRRILMNLVGNSVKYTTCGRIKVSLSREQDKSDPAKRWVNLEVSDTGGGISAEYLQEYLYSPFRQEDTHAVGSGLGLSIVHGIVAGMHGQIDIRSEKHRGTTVRVQLPVQMAGSQTGSSLNVSVDRVRRLKQVDRRLQGCFVNPKTIAQLSGRAPSGAMNDDTLSAVFQNVNVMCSDWLKIDVISCTGPRTVETDFFIVDEACLGNTPMDGLLHCLTKLNQNGIGGSKTGLPVVLAATSDNLVTIRRGLKGTVPSELYCMPKPYGPHQLAEIVTAIFSRASQEARAINQFKSSQDVGFPWTSQKHTDLPDGQSASHESQLAPPLTPLGGTSTSGDTSPSTPYINGFRDPKTVGTHPDSTDSDPMVLLVEDNAVNMKILEMFAKRLKVSYETASDGQKAVDKFAASPRKFDIIWMDINMPVMDGITATRHIRRIESQNRRHRQATIIALTGINSVHDRHDAFTSGMDDFYSKPVKLAVLRESLEKWRKQSNGLTNGSSEEHHGPGIVLAEC